MVRFNQSSLAISRCPFIFFSTNVQPFHMIRDYADNSNYKNESLYFDFASYSLFLREKQKYFQNACSIDILLYQCHVAVALSLKHLVK